MCFEIRMKHLPIAALLLAVALPLHAQTPASPPADPRSEAVRVVANDAVLAGTLVLPEARPRAAVVLVQGAGPHGRDQVISGAPMFAALAEALAARGIASIRIDNAGVGESTGARVAHFRERVPQIGAVLDSLAARPDLADVPLGLLAHSEGTMVATELWPAREGTIDFLVLFGAPGLPGRTVWIDQQANPERFPGRDAETLARIRALFGEIADAAIAANRAAIADAADRLFAVTGLGPEEIAEVRPFFIDRMASPEMQVFLSHDPGAALGRITDPLLALWGSADVLTAPAINVPVFLERTRANHQATVLVLPGEDHFFLRGEGLAPGEHRAGEMQLSPALASAIDRWLADRGW